MKNLAKVISLFAIVLIIFSCRNDANDNTNTEKVFKSTVSYSCNSHQQTTEVTYIFFEDKSYIPTPNTWYTSNNYWWFKTGTDVTPVKNMTGWMLIESTTPYTTPVCR